MANYCKYFSSLISITIGLLFLASCGENAVPNHPSPRTMLIKASSELEAAPDIATFRINLNCKRRSAKDAKACLIEQSNELNTALLSMGIEQTDLQTTFVSMNKNYEWRKNTRIFTGYNSTTSMMVTMRNMDLLDTLYTELLDNRNLQMGHISYTHSNMDSLKSLAYLEALQQAETLSQTLLDQLSLQEKKIMNISNVDISARTPNYANASEVVEESRATSNVQDQSMAVHSGLIKVRTLLFVDYWMK